MKAQSHTRAHASSEAQSPSAVRPVLTSSTAANQGEPVAILPPQRIRGTVRAEDPPLIRVLLREAQRRGDQLQQMADSLGCTYGYICQLRAGTREPQHIGQDFAKMASAYLGVPTALVRISAIVAGRFSLNVAGTSA